MTTTTNTTTCPMAIRCIPGLPPCPMCAANERASQLTIVLSEQLPIRIDTRSWPIVATASALERSVGIGEGAEMGERESCITVRSHADARHIIYGTKRKLGAGFEADAAAGFLLPSKPDGKDLVRAIRRVAGIITPVFLADVCIARLPPEDPTPVADGDRWFEDPVELRLFAQLLVGIGTFTDVDCENALRDLLYYLEKPYKWSEEHARWVALDRPDCEHVTLEEISPDGDNAEDDSDA